MSELVISILVNVVLGIVLLALLYRKRASDTARLAGADEAMNIFGLHFPDALGCATVAADQRGALIDLHGGAGVGLLLRQGRRWNARLLAPGDVAAVELDQEAAVNLRFVDFGWPRARIRIADADACAMWLARLESLTAQSSSRHRADPRHA